MTDPQPSANRRSLSGNILANALNVAVVVATSLLAVPLLVDRLGLEGYGLWTLAQTLIIYVTTAELGVGPAIARFISVHRSHRDRPRQILVAALGLYSAGGLVVVGACHVLAALLVDLFSVTAALRSDAIATVGIVGWVSLVALLAGVLGHMLVGLERFAASTWTNMAGSATFLIALIVLTRGGGRLQDPAYAALAQWSTVMVLRLAALRSLALGEGSRLPERGLMRELVGFSARLQLGVIAMLFNTQTDRVVIGALGSATTLGQASIATQVADAGRMLAYSAFQPMASRMAVTYGGEGEPALDALLRRQRGLWITALLGGIAVAVGAVRPAIEAWLGAGYDKAALFAVFLVSGYGIGLIPGPTFAYLRAKGTPTLEGLFGLVTVVINLAATIVLGWLLGAVGVVVATFAAYVLSTAWLLNRVRSIVPPAHGRPVDVLRLAVALPLCAAATYGAGEALLAFLPRIVALGGEFVAAAAVFAIFLVIMTDLRPLALIRRHLTPGAAAAR